MQGRRQTSKLHIHNCTGSELFAAVKKHSGVPKVDDFQLTTALGREIQDTHLERLEFYGVVNKGTINQVYRVCGGSWPSANDIQARPRTLGITVKIKTTVSAKQPDVLGLDDESRRAIMSCGHAVAPSSLAMHCLYELESGKDKITCPDMNCGREWDFREVRVAACLTEDENSALEQMIVHNKHRNNEEIKQCPRCYSSLKRMGERDKRIVCSVCHKIDGKKYEFCWICLREWNHRGTKKCGNKNCGFVNPENVEKLAKCEGKDVSGVWCPSLRACPKCFTIIEHMSNCKHVRCPYCKYDFCFICLKKYYRGQAKISCKPAPRQTPSDH